MRNNFSFLKVYKKKNKKSEVVTQLLYGDTFKKIKKFRSWIKIKNDFDGYKGYIENKKFASNHKSTHKVYAIFANIYSKPNNINKTSKKLSFSSKIKIVGEKGNFFKADDFWIKKKDLKKNSHKNKDLFFNIKKFINIKYKWGGKHYSGVDCSGLIQLFLNYNK